MRNTLRYTVNSQNVNSQSVNSQNQHVSLYLLTQNVTASASALRDMTMKCTVHSPKKSQKLNSSMIRSGMQIRMDIQIMWHRFHCAGSSATSSFSAAGTCGRRNGSTDIRELLPVC